MISRHIIRWSYKPKLICSLKKIIENTMSCIQVGMRMCLFWVELRTKVIKSMNAIIINPTFIHSIRLHLLFVSRSMSFSSTLMLALILSSRLLCMCVCFLSFVLFSGSLHIAHMEMTIKCEQWKISLSPSLSLLSFSLFISSDIFAFICCCVFCSFCMVLIMHLVIGI